MNIEIKNAIIESTELGTILNGIMGCYLNLNYGGSGQGFGGYVFCSPRKDSKFGLERVGTAWGMEFIMRVLKTVGVEKWEDLKGKHLRVKAEHNKVHEIGHIIEEKWFNPDEIKNYLEEA